VAKPFVLVNYKIYRESTGRRALDLTRALASAAAGARADVAVAVQAADIRLVAGATPLPVWAQHADGAKPGVGTGAALAEALAEAGARGSLVNHAERKLTLAEIATAVARLKEAGLASVVCTSDPATTAAAAALEPGWVAFEPPELIGGDVSVTTADPAIVRASVEAAKRVAPDVPVLCGAGVKTGEDLRAALALGCDGVLLASGIVKAADPAKALAGLLSGLS